MKIQIQEVVVKEVEISFPCYLKHGTGFYKIIDENNWIVVHPHSCIGDEKTIAIHTTKPSWLTGALVEGQKITIGTFNEAFHIVLNEILTHKIKPVELPDLITEPF
jgi:hypothetical protein